jgi:putative intracellular protease/amidase
MVLPFYLESRERVINDKTAAGFATEGEVQINILEKIKHTAEEDAAAVGAIYITPLTPFADFNKTDGKVVAGANPSSAHSTTGATIAAFDTTKSLFIARSSFCSPPSPPPLIRIR